MRGAAGKKNHILFSFFSIRYAVKKLLHTLYKEFNLYRILQTKCTDALLAADPNYSQLELKGI